MMQQFELRESSLWNVDSGGRGLRQRIEAGLDHFWFLSLILILSLIEVGLIVTDMLIDAQKTCPKPGPLPAQKVIRIISISILLFFAAELLLRIIVKGKRFFISFGNYFDVAIIAVSIVFSFLTINGAVALIIILRVWRIVKLAWKSHKLSVKYQRVKAQHAREIRHEDPEISYGERIDLLKQQILQLRDAQSTGSEPVQVMHQPDSHHKKDHSRRKRASEILDSFPFLCFAMVLSIIAAALAVTDLVIEELKGCPDPGQLTSQFIMSIITLCILSILAAEVIVRLIVQGTEFAKSIGNMFDAVIVATSIVFTVITPSQVGALVIVLRLWRVTMVAFNSFGLKKELHEFKETRQQQTRHTDPTLPIDERIELLRTRLRELEAERAQYSQQQNQVA